MWGEMEKSTFILSSNRNGHIATVVIQNMFTAIQNVHVVTLRDQQKVRDCRNHQFKHFSEKICQLCPTNKFYSAFPEINVASMPQKWFQWKKNRNCGVSFSLPRLTKNCQIYTVLRGFARLNLKNNFCGRGKKEPLCFRVKVFLARLATTKAKKFMNSMFLCEWNLKKNSDSPGWPP